MRGVIILNRIVKLSLILALSVFLITGGWYFLSPSLAPSEERFSIVLLWQTDEEVVSGEDIIVYNQSSHEIKLTEGGINKIKGFELVKKNFEIKLNNKRIYGGTFWSNIFSEPKEGVVILDVLLLQQGKTDTLKIEPSYPPSLFKGEDPRNNTEIFNYFRKVGKLIQ